LHSGDNRTGFGEGDDETITIHLDRVHPAVFEIFCTVNIYAGTETFKRVKHAYCRLIHPGGQKEICRYKLKEFKDDTAVIFAKLLRESPGNPSWKILAIGESAKARTAQELTPLIQNRFLQSSMGIKPLPPFSPAKTIPHQVAQTQVDACVCTIL